MLSTNSRPYTNIWVGKTEGTADAPSRHLYVVHIFPLPSFNHVPSQTAYAAWLLDAAWLKYIQDYRLTLIIVIENVTNGDSESSHENGESRGLDFTKFSSLISFSVTHTTVILFINNVHSN